MIGKFNEVSYNKYWLTMGEKQPIVSQHKAAKQIPAIRFCLLSYLSIVIMFSQLHEESSDSPTESVPVRPDRHSAGN